MPYEIKISEARMIITLREGERPRYQFPFTCVAAETPSHGRVYIFTEQTSMNSGHTNDYNCIYCEGLSLSTGRRADIVSLPKLMVFNHFLRIQRGIRLTADYSWGKIRHYETLRRYADRRISGRFGGEIV